MSLVKPIATQPKPLSKRNSTYRVRIPSLPSGSAVVEGAADDERGEEDADGGGEDRRERAEHGRATSPPATSTGSDGVRTFEGVGVALSFTKLIK